MEIKPIKTKKDYHTALNEIERLFESKPYTPEGDRLDVLTTLVEAYEETHHNIPKLNPIDSIFYYIESRRLFRIKLDRYRDTGHSSTPAHLCAVAEVDVTLSGAEVCSNIQFPMYIVKPYKLKKVA